MSDVKFKGFSENKSDGKYILVKKSISNASMNSAEKKFNYRDCANEIFAGLMWSG